MKTKLFVALVFSLVAVGANASAVATSASDFVFACQASLNWDKPRCECAASKASKELTPRGFEFQVETFRGNQAEIDKLHGEMTAQEITQSTTFMLRAGKACTGG